MLKAKDTHAQVGAGIKGSPYQLLLDNPYRMLVTVIWYFIVTILCDNFPENVQEQEGGDGRNHVLGKKSHINKAQALGPESPGFSFITDTTSPCMILIRSLNLFRFLVKHFAKWTTELIHGLRILYELELGLSAYNKKTK